jgi:succinate-semialdehyde dehydrogenase/glutarate-semialdehyde dehydrogenase
MGGMKDSGIGRRHGPEGLLKHTEPRTVASQRVPLTPPSWLPYRVHARLLDGTTWLLHRLDRLRTR